MSIQSSANFKMKEKKILLTGNKIRGYFYYSNIVMYFRLDNVKVDVKAKFNDLPHHDLKF